MTFLSFFSILAWYAPVYQAQGWSDAAAGSLVAAVFVAQLVAALAVTTAFARRTVRRRLMLLGMLLSVTGLAGAAFIPLAAPWVWATSTGLGLGVQFTLALTLPVEFGADPDEVGRLTAMAMSVGGLPPSAWRFVETGRRAALVQDVTLAASTPVVIEKRTVVSSSHDQELQASARRPIEDIANRLQRLEPHGHDALRETHAGEWARRWASCDVQIDGDPPSQRALRVALFHLLRAHPGPDSRVSIDAASCR